MPTPTPRTLPPLPVDAGIPPGPTPGPRRWTHLPGILLGVAWLGAAGTACTTPAPPALPELGSAEELETRRALFLVSPDELMSLREEGDASLVILEVGSDPEIFQTEGHVAGAHFLPWESVAMERGSLPNQVPPLDFLAERLRERGVTDASRIVLYDRGAGLQAGRAWAVLDYVGLGAQTRLLDGQLAGWLGAGGEVAQGSPDAPTPGELSLTPDPGVILSGDRVADLVWARSTQSPASLHDLHLLDARPAEEFSGEIPGGRVVRPGHIPGARNLPWRTTLGPDDAPFFLDAAALQSLFAEVGVEPGSPVVTYCRTGGQAGQLYFVARMLGHEARFYDGSFVEWSGNSERPVVPPAATDSPELLPQDTP